MVSILWFACYFTIFLTASHSTCAEKEKGNQVDILKSEISNSLETSENGEENRKVNAVPKFSLKGGSAMEQAGFVPGIKEEQELIPHGQSLELGDTKPGLIGDLTVLAQNGYGLHTDGDGRVSGTLSDKPSSSLMLRKENLTFGNFDEGNSDNEKVAENYDYHGRSLTEGSENVMIEQGIWGDWKPYVNFPLGYYACGARMRFEDPGGDDTAGNGLQMAYCHADHWCWQYWTTIEDGLFGNWKDYVLCPEDKYISGAQVRFENNQGGGDDTALNGLKIYCVDRNFQNGEWKTVYDGVWGDWKGQVTRSDKFVIGAQDRFERSQGGGDDTALNGIQFQMARPTFGIGTNNPACTSVAEQNRPGLNYLGKRKDYAYCSSQGTANEHTSWANKYFNGNVASFSVQGDEDKDIFDSVKCEIYKFLKVKKLLVNSLVKREVVGWYEYQYSYLANSRTVASFMTPNRLDKVTVGTQALSKIGGTCYWARKDVGAYIDDQGLRGLWHSFLGQTGGLYVRDSQQLPFTANIPNPAIPSSTQVVKFYLTSSGLVDLCSNDDWYYVANDVLLLKVQKFKIPLSNDVINFFPAEQYDIKAFFKITHELKNRNDVKSGVPTGKSNVCYGENVFCADVEMAQDVKKSSEFEIQKRLPNGDMTFFNFPYMSDKNYYVQIHKIEIRYECPTGSTAIFETKPLCKCKDGMVNARTAGPYVKFDGRESCTYPPVQLRAEAMSTKAAVFAKGSIPSGVRKFKINLFQKLQNSGRIEVHPLHDSYVEKDILLSNLGLQMDNLIPGRRYSIGLLPVDEYLSPVSNRNGEISFVTHCSCDSIIWRQDIQSNVDYTGKPRDFVITQDKGIVTFRFKPFSCCEEAYAFSRKLKNTLDEPATFAPSFPFLPSKRCQPNVVATGMQSADDLTKSLLIAGLTYTYCVRALAAEYMHDPVDAAKPSLPSSTETCSDHIIRWEGSVDGKVILEPSAGSLPVRDVTATWKLMDESMKKTLVSGVVVTGVGGRFKIEVNEILSDVNNNAEYPMLIKLSKTSESGGLAIRHTFTCGPNSCPDDTMIIYLKHLDFNEPLLVYDSTAVPFSGRVEVAGTGSPGCPIFDVEVCLVDATKNDTSIIQSGMCTKTDPQGAFSIGAVLGMRLKPVLSYKNHTFTPLDWRRTSEYEKGILIEAGKSYENNNFQDVTTVSLSTEVAGGLCDLVMGDSSVELMIAGGCKWTRRLNQTGVRQSHMVPAHRVTLRLSNLVKEGQVLNVVLDALKNRIETIDLRDIAQESSKENSTMNQYIKTEEEENLKKNSTARLVRFQYNGTLMSKFVVTPDKADECSASYSKECDSLHVADSAKVLRFTIKLSYDIVGQTCDIVREELETKYINFLGLSKDDEKNWPDYKDLEEQDVATLQACNQDSNGCDVSIIHDVQNTTQGHKKKSNARVEFSVITGPPNPVENYLKYLDFYIDDVLFHKACFVIEGDYTIKHAGSIPLPTYKPILVIRDPPGGLSYASYQNVQTSMKLQNGRLAGTTSYRLKFAAEVEAEASVDVCTGAGFGAILIGCKNTVTAGLKTEFSSGVEGTLNIYDKAWSDSKGFMTTWSYQTSDDPELGGRNSDTFVVPNLNVKYSEVREISFNSSLCEASIKDMTKFSLDSNANKPTLSFLTVLHIEDNIIPSYKKLINSTKEKIENKEDQETNEKALTELEEGLQNWMKNLEEYEKTNTDAKTGKLSKEKVNSWFEIMTKPDDKDEHPNPEDYFYSIIPKRLYDNAVPTGNRSNSVKLKETNQIEFVGGSSVFEFGLSLTNGEEGSIILPAMKGENTIGLETKILTEGKIFGVGGKTGVDTAFFLTFEHELSSGYSKETESSISLVVGDPDATNFFVIDIYVDPTYGTFIFNTEGGLSSCPHEEGTDYAVKVEIEVQSSPKMKVLPDEQMVFQLKLKNTGLAADNLELLPDNSANSGMLALFVNGGPFTNAQVYQDFEPLSSFSTMLTVMRGPIAFRYPPIKVILRDSCHSETSSVELFNKIDKEGRWIEFEQKCPEVRWAGALRDEQSFTINQEASANGRLPITLFNPSYQQYSFATAVNFTRLQSVQLYYRDVGNHRWYEAQTVGSTNNLRSLNFCEFKEDDYGYVTASWAYSESGLLDGKYELKIQTNCEELASAPINFNQFADSILPGVIDRSPPKEYGSATPREGTPLWPGEEVSFLFTEALLCEQPFKFQFRVTVDGLLDGVTNEQAVFGNDNLNVLCEQNKIAFTFDGSKVKYSELGGKEIQVQLNNVTDLVGNVMKNPLLYRVVHADMDLAETGASFVFSLESNCTNPLPSNAAEMAKAHIASLLGIKNPSRLEISDIFCDDVIGKLASSVRVLAPKPERHLSALELDGDEDGSKDKNYADNLNAVHLAELLIDKAHGTNKESGVLGQISHLKIHLSEKDEVKKKKDLVKQHYSAVEWWISRGGGPNNASTPVLSQWDETQFSSILALQQQLEGIRANMTHTTHAVVIDNDTQEKKGLDQQLLEKVQHEAQRRGEITREQEKEQLLTLHEHKFEEFRVMFEHQEKQQGRQLQQQGKQLQQILLHFESKFEQFELKSEHRQMVRNKLLFSGGFLFLLSVSFLLVVHIKTSKRHWVFDNSTAAHGGPIGQQNGIPCV